METGCIKSRINKATLQQLKPAVGNMKKDILMCAALFVLVASLFVSYHQAFALVSSWHNLIFEGNIGF